MAEVGVQMFTLRRWTQTIGELREALARVKEIGYDTIQASAFGPIPVEEVAKSVADAGLTVSATHTPWPRLLAELDDVIAEHQVLECHHTAVGMIPPDTYLTLAGLNQFVEEARSIVDKLGASEITFSYHHHHHEFQHFQGKPWLQHLVDASLDFELGFEIDTHWVVAGGADPVQWIQQVGHRMPLLHLKDFRLSADNERQFAAIGQGNMNWGPILDAAEAEPIDYYFVEQDRCYGEDPFECLKQSREFLKEAIG